MTRPVSPYLFDDAMLPFSVAALASLGFPSPPFATTLWTVPWVPILARWRQPFLTTEVWTTHHVIFMRVDHRPLELRRSDEEINLTELPEWHKVALAVVCGVSLPILPKPNRTA